MKSKRNAAHFLTGTILVCTQVLAYDVGTIEGLSAEEKREFYVDFIDSISDESKFSDEDIIEIIAFGLDNENEELKVLLLSAVAYEALRYYYGSNPGQPVSAFFISPNHSVARNLSEVSRIRELGLKNIRSGLVDDSWIAERRVPSWWLLYIPLVVYFPYDSEVETLILDSIEALPSSLGDFLSFLTYGRFDSNEVQRIRFESLHHESTVVAKKAARGIMDTLPEDGLGHLISALNRTDSALVEVVEGIAEYKEPALVALPRLDELLMEMDRNFGGNWTISANERAQIAALIDTIRAYEINE